MFLSHANRPARVFIRSDDAIDRAGSGNPGDFLMPMTEPILEARGVQLLSARVPNIFPQIPDYQRWFLYQLTDFEGFVHLRGFRLCATSERQRFFVNYQDLCDQLNDDAKYWIEFDVTETVTSRTYLSIAAALVPGVPDVSFEYNAPTRKILTKNVSPAPYYSGLELTEGLNNVLRFNRTPIEGTGAGYYFVHVAAGIYNTVAELAPAIQTALDTYPGGAVPISVTASGPKLIWTWQGLQPNLIVSLDCNKTDNPQQYPEILARNSALAFGFPYGYVNSQVQGATFESTPPPNINSSPPGLQLCSVREAAQTLEKTELVKPYLFLNQILGYNVGELQPSAPVANGSVIWPASFGDLVRTQTIYVKSNLTLNGTLTSNGMRDILQTIPVQVPPLGVISYQSSQAHFIAAVPTNIMCISIKLIDENGQALPMTLNAQTEFEIGFLYGDSVE